MTRRGQHPALKRFLDDLDKREKDREIIQLTLREIKRTKDEKDDCQNTETVTPRLTREN